MLAMNSIKNVTFVKWKNYFRWVSAASCRASPTRTVAHQGCIAEILESVICHKECRNKNIADSLKSWINNWFKGAYKHGIPQIEFKSMLKLLKKWEAKQLWTTSAHFSFGSGTTGFQAITSIQCPDVWSFLYLPACITTFYHSLHSCPVHVFLNLLSQLLNSCLLRRMSLYPPLLPVFTCLPLVSFLSIFLRFSITLSPLLIPLADPQREPREWVGLKRERSAVLYPARSSLARLKHSEEKRKKKKTQHTHTTQENGELFPSLIFSFLHLSTLLSHHSWVVWYLTFTLLQQGLRSEFRERKLVSPLSYSVIPLRLFPLPLSFLLSLLPFLPVSISVMFSALQSSNGRKKNVEIPWPTPTFLPIMYSVRLLHRLLSLMRTVLLLFL